jgi:hypothetical protein
MKASNVPPSTWERWFTISSEKVTLWTGYEAVGNPTAVRRTCATCLPEINSSHIVNIAMTYWRMAARLLGLRVRIPPGHGCLSLSSECCVLSIIGIWVGLITRPEESYQVWCDWAWSRSLDNEKALGPLGAVAPCIKKRHNQLNYFRLSFSDAVKMAY